MAFKLLIRPIVIFDVEEIVEYYNKKLAGLGERFYLQFLSSLTDIETQPFTFFYVTKNVRRHIINKFPYKIFYTVSGENIFILGVAHAKRSNAFIRRKLRLQNDK